MTNSQVPFILVTGVPKTTEQLAQIASDYPNAIIFYKYTDSNTGITESSIWAHGEEYKTGGSDAHYKISSTLRIANDVTDQTNGTIDGWTPSIGDIFVEKNIISGSGANEKAEYTAYVWSIVAGGTGKAWRALDGNYNAANVYFTDNITLAGDYIQVGNVTKADANATGILSAQGISVKDLFESIFTKEVYPETSQTSTATLTASVTAPTPVIKDGNNNNVSNGSLIAVGTSGLVLQSATAGSVSTGGETLTTVSGFTYGYAEDVSGSNASEDTSVSVTRGEVSAVSNTKYSIAVTVSGFSNPTVTNPTDDADNANVVVSSTSLGNVESGANSITFTETGRPQTANVGNIPEKYIKSNIGHYSADHKSSEVASTTLTTEAPEDSKTIKIYGAYPIVTNGVASNNSASNDAGAYNGSNHETKGNITLTTTYLVSSGSVSTKTFYVGFGAQENKYWDIYIPSDYLISTAKKRGVSNDWTKLTDLVVQTFDQDQTTTSLTGYSGTYYKYRSTGQAGPTIIQFVLTNRPQQ